MAIAEATRQNVQPPTIKGNFEAQESEYDYWVTDIEGTVPGDLTGSFFRNGPGRLKLGGEPVGHWFDGDGMIARTTFTEGKVHFSNKFIRTPKYVDETAAGKFLYRGFGGAPKGNFFKRFSPPANPANTGLILHAGKFLALNEGGRPYSIDPASLDTYGEFTYDGSLSKTNVFSAHGKINPKNGCYYNFGLCFDVGWGGLKPGFELYKIDPSGHMVQRARFALDHMPLLHDFAMTENYAIFIQSSVSMQGNVLMTMLKNESFADLMLYDKHLTNKVIIIDLHSLKRVDTIEIDPIACLHFGNAYEKNGEIHFDLMETKEGGFGTPDQKMEPLDIFSEDVNFRSGAARYKRCVVNLKSRRFQSEYIDDALEGEFPQWDWTRTTSENRYALATGYTGEGPKTYFNAIQKIDRESGKVEVHDFGSYRYTGEPLMVAKPNAGAEDDFYCLCYVYNGNSDKSEVVVIDGKDFEEPLATIKLDFHIPQGFHGMFSPKVFL
ncbi:carotenoid oxygenase family protein [Microbulbifer agarilyticus]|uniref:carotenoid oxygenase family protein n=1 Tax=Microbulbifer agarilyticus TaxID=260552 RepID=UPI001C956AF7|nr:carotenoid oxygenase family protein [Microbulbifer agarilyticus]MBY6189259.1 carotenoid oxygenase family protein [Microbulbifer agarilyticus]